VLADVRPLLGPLKKNLVEYYTHHEPFPYLLHLMVKTKEVKHLEFVISQTGGIDLDLNINLAKKGDSKAFERLITENKTSMYRVAKGILRTESDISEAIQEAIFKAYKGLPQLRNHSYFKTWLIRILINECNTILRYHKKIVPLAEVEQNNTVPDPHDEADLLTAVKSLEEDLRVVTILFYYEDLPIKTISSIINVSEGTVKSRLSRARRKLYSFLTGKEEVRSEREANR
jgi:RNA polymerase sigma-70 factor, ECF subfamily